MTGRRALRSRAGGPEVTFTVLLSIHIHISNVTVGIVNEDARAASLADPVSAVRRFSLTGPSEPSSIVHHDLDELLLADLAVLVQVELVDHRLATRAHRKRGGVSELGLADSKPQRRKTQFLLLTARPHPEPLLALWPPCADS